MLSLKFARTTYLTVLASFVEQNGGIFMIIHHILYKKILLFQLHDIVWLDFSYNKLVISKLSIRLGYLHNFQLIT